jgi:hypothetical protein
MTLGRARRVVLRISGIFITAMLIATACAWIRSFWASDCFVRLQDITVLTLRSCGGEVRVYGVPWHEWRRERDTDSGRWEYKRLRVADGFTPLDESGTQEYGMESQTHWRLAGVEFESHATFEFPPRYFTVDNPPPGAEPGDGDAPIALEDDMPLALPPPTATPRVAKGLTRSRISGRSAGWSLSISYITLIIPLALATISFGVGVRRSIVRGKAGKCPRCGYDLRATPDRCPECGMRQKWPKKGANEDKIRSAR